MGDFCKPTEPTPKSTRWVFEDEETPVLVQQAAVALQYHHDRLADVQQQQGDQHNNFSQEQRVIERNQNHLEVPSRPEDIPPPLEVFDEEDQDEFVSPKGSEPSDDDDDDETTCGNNATGHTKVDDTIMDESSEYDGNNELQQQNATTKPRKPDFVSETEGEGCQNIPTTRISKRQRKKSKKQKDPDYKPPKSVKTRSNRNN